jgi:hypothetical protein
MAQPSANNRSQDDDHPGEREQVGVHRRGAKPGLERTRGGGRERVVEQIGRAAKPDERQAGAQQSATETGAASLDRRDTPPQASTSATPSILALLNKSSSYLT